MRSLITLCILVFGFGTLQAQFPITSTINLAPPYPTNLDAYVDYLESGIIEIQNSGSQDLDVYFEVLFEEVNGRISIKKDALLGPAISIAPGLTFLSPNEVSEIFEGLTDDDFQTNGLSQAQKEAIMLNRQIPEGSYRICIKAFDETGTLLSDPTDDGCFFFEVTFAERPIIVAPGEDEVAADVDFIIPTWDHNLSNPTALARTEYIVKIIDLTEQEITNIQRAMLDPGISPDYEENVGQQNTVNLLNDIDIPLLVGHRYAIRVTAVDPENIVAYDFGGHSEIVTFWYGDTELPPEVVEVPAPKIIQPKENSMAANKNEVDVIWEHNLPSLQSIAGLKYTLNFLDVTGKKKNEVKKIFNDPATNYQFSTETTSKKQKVRTSVQVPLKIGNQYAAQVIYTRPQTLPEHIQFINDGASEVITFTYGNINDDFVPDLDPLLKDHVQGQVFWAFRSTEESPEGNNEDLVTTNLADLPTESTSYANNFGKAGDQKHPLENAQVIIWGDIEPGWVPKMRLPLAVGLTEADGKYAVRLNDSYLHYATNFYLQIVKPNAFEYLHKRIELDQTDFGYFLGKETLAANNMRLAVKVLKEDYAETENVSVNLLLQKDNFEANEFLKQIAPNGGSDVVDYNNDQYVVAHTFNDADLHKNIFQNNHNFENYVLEVRVEGKPSAFYPQESVFLPRQIYDRKSTPTINKNLIYNIGTEVGGVVYFGEDPRRDARVRIVLDDGDVSGAYDSSLEYIRLTNEDGEYSFNDLPNFNTGAKIDVEVIDRTIREQAFMESFEYDGNSPVEKDIVLRNEIFTAFGTLRDQYGLPVANALINVDSSQTVRSTEDGFFMVKLNSPMPFYLKVVADGYDDSYIYPGYSDWFGGFFGDVTKIDPKLDENQKASQWQKNINKVGFVKSYLDDEDKSSMDAEDLGIGFGSLKERYPTYFAKTETLAGTVALNYTRMENKQGVIGISAKYQGELVSATIKFESVNGFEKEDQLVAGEFYYFSAPDDTYSFSITPNEGGPSFVQFFGEIEMSSSLNTRTTIILQEGVKVSGIVKDLESEEPLAEAEVSIDGLDFNATSDEEGKYSLYLPANDEYTFSAKKRKYNRRDTSFLVQDEDIVFDFLLQARDPNLPDFTTIAGYKVELDFLEPAGEGFLVGGELTLEGNDLFTPKKGEEVLEFKDVLVETNEDNEDDGTPTQNFFFEISELNVTAFGYAPVIVNGGPRIELRMLEGPEGDEVNTKAVVGGTELTLELEANPTFSAFPFKFPNATMKNAEREDYVENKLEELGFDISGKTPEEIAAKKETAGTVAGALFEELNYERVFVSPNAKIKEINEDVEYNITYEEPDFEGGTNLGTAPAATDKYDNYIVSKFAMTKLLVEKEKSTLNKDGINMEGALEMPKFVGAKMKLKDNQIQIKKLSIGKNFSINELSFMLDSQNPIKGSMKTWELRLSSLQLFGLGTKNMGMGFGGDVRLKKDSKVQGQDSSHLVINTFNIINKEDVGVTVTADLSFKPKGLQVGPLKISQEEGKNVKLALSKKDFAFEISASNLKLETTSTNAISKKVFPLEILRFEMKSKDWSVFVAMKPNINLDFGVVKVQISKFLLNYGYDMGMDEMNEILKMTDEEREEFFGKTSPGMSEEDVAFIKSSIAAKKQAGLPVPKHMTDAIANHERKQQVNSAAVSAMNEMGGDELLDEDKINWAIGISGGVQFPIKGMESSIHASLLLARNNDKFDFRLNELLLQLEQPAFKLKVAAELSLGGEKVGFSGDAEMETLKKKFAAGFKFFKYTNSNDFEIGAKLIVSTKIVTGPVLWHQLGGGFDFNTKTKRYMVFVQGAAGPIGTPQKMTSIEEAYVSILFDLKKCKYQPIVEGRATFTVKNQDYGNIDARLDFCKFSAYLQISNTMELAAGLVTAKISGTVYVMKDGSQGRLYLGLNAYCSDKLGIFKGNGVLGIGVNFKKTSSTPYPLVQTFNKMPSIAKPGGRFHGLFLGLDMSIPEKKGKWGISLGSFDFASFQFYASASAYAHIFKSFDRTDFQVVGKLAAEAGGSLRFLGSTLIGGSASAKLGVEGGYVNAWYFKANGSLNLSVYNKRSLSCNRITFGTFKSCMNIHYPCGPWWCAGLCKWCYCCRKCVTLPKVIPDFKKCFNASFSYSVREGQSAKVSFSTN